MPMILPRMLLSVAVTYNRYIDADFEGLLPFLPRLVPKLPELQPHLPLLLPHLDELMPHMEIFVENIVLP